VLFQVVAGLLEESLGINVFARRYCPGGYTWQQHLEDAQDPKRSLYRLLGEGGKKHWDYIIFQVRHGRLGSAEHRECGTLQPLPHTAPQHIALLTLSYRTGHPRFRKPASPDVCVPRMPPQ
jgi:hypothetical protein